MAPRIDFTHLTRLFEERDHLADWQALLGRATLPVVAADYAVGPALEDALVDFLKLDWETTEDCEGLYADYEAFVRLVRQKRNDYQKQEIKKLHRLWKKNDGRSELSADMSLEEVLRRFQGDVTHLIQGGGTMVGNLFNLPIDPSLLNGGLTNFPGGRGQIMFMAALAVVTGKYDYSISRLPKTAQEARTNIKALKWKKLPIDWRRGHAILGDMGGSKNWWQQFVGLEGYREFTFLYADGDMQKGFTIASALLEMQGKRGIGEVLKWQGLHIKTIQLPQLKQALDELITKAAQPDYDALGEYASWSNKWAGGDMEKGFKIASALLEMQGKGEIGEVLKWHALLLKTSDLAFIVEARKQPRPPSTLAVPSRLAGVIMGRSFTGLQKMLSMAPAPVTLTPAPKSPASASAHVSGLHVAGSRMTDASPVVYLPAHVRTAITLIGGQPMITDCGIEGALALAPEIQIVAPVAANDDVKNFLHIVTDTASLREDELKPPPLATELLAPHLFGSAHLVSRGVSHHVLRIVP